MGRDAARAQQALLQRPPGRHLPPARQTPQPAQPQPQTPPPAQPLWTPPGTPPAIYAPAPQPQQQQQAGSDPWANFQPGAAADPWSAGAAPQHFNMGTPGDKGGGKGGFGGGGFNGGGFGNGRQALRIDARAWGHDTKKLEVGSGFEAFQMWKARALMFLSRDRPDVRKLLTWAEAQTKEDVSTGLITEAGNLEMCDLDAGEYALHDGIQCIIMDSLLGRARTSNGCGCELWRSLIAEWSGAAPQLKQDKARRFLEPTRCKDVAQLWAKLPAWHPLGREATLAGRARPARAAGGGGRGV